MFKTIKTKIIMKKLERQMKFELLSELYTLISEKKKYLNLLHELADTPQEDLKSAFISAIAGTIHDEAQKETA